ncbi:MAG: sigma-70 family RNA polymerase sigma factor [Bacteroidota bacterium]
MTEEEIIEHLQNNKYSTALKGLYNVLPLAKKYITTNNGTTDDAADIFQDALVILCKKVKEGNLTLTVPLKTYLMGIVKNCWLQELRLRKKLPQGETNNDLPSIEVNEEPGFVLAKAAFDLLGEKCRQLLILFYFKKESFKNIATALAFSDEKIAKNQKYRCLQKAKENYVTLSNNGNHE